MLETQILQGCMVCERVEHTMTHQKVGSVGTVFANSNMSLIKNLELCRCSACGFLRIFHRLNGNQGINYGQASQLLRLVMTILSMRMMVPFFSFLHGQRYINDIF